MIERTESTWSRTQQRLWIITMFIGCAAVYAARTAVPLCIVAISKEMNWDKTQSGSVLSAFYWGYTITQVLGGHFADKLGGDMVVALTATAWSLLTFWTPVIIDFYPYPASILPLIVLSRVLMGCLQGMHYPAISSLFSRRIPESERAFSFSTAISGTHLGTLISGSVGSYLLDLYGWRCVFYVTGTLGMAWVVFLRYYLISKQIHKEKLLYPINAVEKHSKEEVPNKNQAVPWLILFRSAAFWSIVVAHFGHAWGFNVLVNWLPTYFHETFPHEKGWVFNVVPWLLCIPTGFFGGWLSDLLTAKGLQVTLVRKLITTVAMLGVCFFLLMVAQTEDYFTALILMTLALTCNAFHASAICVIPQDIAPRYSGFVYGVMNTAGSITGFVGVYIAGYVLETTKNWTLVFTETSVVVFIGWLVFIIFGTGKRII